MMDTYEPTIGAEPADAVDTTSSLNGDGDEFMDEIIAALRTVHDPEIPVNIYDLGLIYRIDVKDQGLVEIDMTLTAPGCPVAGEMLGWVEKAVGSLEGVAETKVSLVFDPPWDQSRMAEATKLELGLA